VAQEYCQDMNSLGKGYMKTSVEVITSAYNEEDCLPELFRRLGEVFSQETDYEFRVLVIDNGSTDSTWEIISSISDIDPRIRGFRMSRNFSLDAAFTCGLDHASSDVAIIMTSDLQDSPEVIHRFLREFENGYDQVLGKVVNRETVPMIRRVLSGTFYKLASKLTDGMLPKSVSDFRLVNRKTYTAIRSLRESHRFLRGLGAWVGFKTIEIEIERPPRFAGESKWLGISLFKAISTAGKSILAYSAAPLIWVSFLGLLLSIFSGLAVVVLTFFWIFSGVPFAGYGSIVAIICLSFSLTMLGLGIVAQYIGLIYDEVKQRPLYLISEKTINSN
jgi:glycosyltransferase involved in cell wall biosynthesis